MVHPGLAANVLCYVFVISSFLYHCSREKAASFVKLDSVTKIFRRCVTLAQVFEWWSLIASVWTPLSTLPALHLHCKWQLLVFDWAKKRYYFRDNRNYLVNVNERSNTRTRSITLRSTRDRLIGTITRWPNWRSYLVISSHFINNFYFELNYSNDSWKKVVSVV